MYIIEVAKYPDRKRKAIVVYDNDKPNIRYIIGYINNNNGLEEELFKQALIDSKNVIYVKEGEGDKNDI